MISTIKEAIEKSANMEADFYLKYHTYLSILHGLVSIQMIEKTESPTEQNCMILTGRNFWIYQFPCCLIIPNFIIFIVSK